MRASRYSDVIPASSLPSFAYARIHVQNEVNDMLNDLLIEDKYGATTVPTSTLRAHSMVHEGGCTALAWNAKTEAMVSAGMDRVIRVWPKASANAKDCTRLMGTVGSILDVDISVDALFVLSGSSDKCARIWCRRTERARHVLQGHMDQVLAVKFLPFEPLRAVTAGKDRVLKLWEGVRGACTRSMPCHSIINATEVGTDGTLYTGHYDGKLRQWDFRSGRQTLEMADLHSGAGGVTSLCLGYNGYTMLTCGRDNTLKLIDIRSFERKQTLRHPSFRVTSNTTSATLSPSGEFAACGSANNNIYIWDVKSGEVVQTLSNHEAPVTACAWGTSNLASCDKSGSVIFWK